MSDWTNFFDAETPEQSLNFRKPRKPNRYGSRTSRYLNGKSVSTYFMEFGKCAACNLAVLRRDRDENINFCCRCGQRIGWPDDEVIPIDK